MPGKRIRSPREPLCCERRKWRSIPSSEVLESSEGSQAEVAVFSSPDRNQGV